MAARNTLRRSLLYGKLPSYLFPAFGKLQKNRRTNCYASPGILPALPRQVALLTADCVAYDLEDSVTPHMKAEARSLVRRAIDQAAPTGIRERAVRINSVDSGLALHDLTEVLQSPNLSTIVIPKVNSASDLTFVSDVINHILSQQPQTETPRPPISLLALVESAKSLTNLTQICAATPLLQGLIFAAEDFALDLSITRTPSLREFLFARSAIATAARAAELTSTIDLVCTAFKSESGDGKPPAVLREECLDGRRLGFNGKQCIHPSQVKVADEVFGPDAIEMEWAVRVVVADEKAAKAGRGAWTLDGKMIDVPVAMKAKAIVRKAEECGVNVVELRAKWEHQEPE
ncbi:hypothetical protein N7444_000568 [Penicillium canescens]|nr:hypothetical protein N7444_000568 [Penicillium canescens]